MLSQSVFDGDIAQIIWLKSAIGLGGISGFAMTNNNSLYRSDDAGASWASINDHLQNFTLPPTHFCQGSCYGASAMFASADNTVLFVTSFGGTLWVIKSDSTEYDSFQYDRLLYLALYPHPSNRAVLVATHVSPCCWNGPPSDCPTCVVSVRAVSTQPSISKLILCFQLSSSDNFGLSWTLVDSYVAADSRAVVWGRLPPAVGRIDGDDEPLVSTDLLYSRFTEKRGDQRRLRGSRSPTEIVRVGDYRFPAISSYVVIDGGFALFWAGGRVFGVATAEPGSGCVVLLSSRDGIHFMKEQIPDSPHHGNTVGDVMTDVRLSLTTPEGKVFLVVERRDLGPQDNDVYVYTTGKPPGKNAVFSFSSLRRKMLASRMTIGSANPIFANRLGSRSSPEPETVLSFDSGASWLHLRSLLPQGTNCTEEMLVSKDELCRFHFSLVSHFADSKTGSGTMLATGNVGNRLVLDSSQMGTYLSRDAGFSWRFVRKGSNVVAMTSHGEVMLTVPESEGTDIFEASFNYGAFWFRCRATNDSSPIRFIADGVIEGAIDPSTQLLFVGTVSSNETLEPVLSKRNVLLSITFHPEQVERNCTEADFEETDFAQRANCTHGRRFQIQRRKASSKCRIVNESSVVSWEPCECTDADFVCDECFHPVARECFFARGLCPNHELAHILFSCTGSYLSNYTGFQRDNSSHCVGGVSKSEGLRALPCVSSPISAPPTSRDFTPPTTPDTTPRAAPAHTQTTAGSAVFFAMLGGLLLCASVLLVCFVVRRCRKAIPQRELIRDDNTERNSIRMVERVSHNPFLPQALEMS